MTRTLCLTILLFVSLGSTSDLAHAEFTFDEKTNEARYRAAVFHVTAPMWGSLASTLSAYITPTTKSAVTAATQTTLRALNDLNDGYSALAGDVATDQRGTVGFARLDESRDARLFVALAKVARLKWMLPQAMREWKAAAALSRDVSYRDNISRIHRHLEFALAAISAFDTTLPYLDPKPLNGTRFAPEAIVGPHGDFRENQWEGWRGRHYAIRTAQHLITAVQAGPMPQFSYVNFGRPLINIGVITEQAFKVSASISGMNGAAEDVFGRALDSLRILTSRPTGIPGKQHAFSAEIDRYLAQLGKNAEYDRYVRSALVHFSDSWSHFNEAAWQLMIFPGCPPVCTVGR